MYLEGQLFLDDTLLSKHLVSRANQTLNHNVHIEGQYEYNQYHYCMLDLKSSPSSNRISSQWWLESATGWYHVLTSVSVTVQWICSKIKLDACMWSYIFCPYNTKKDVYEVSAWSRLRWSSIAWPPFLVNVLCVKCFGTWTQGHHTDIQHVL